MAATGHLHWLGALLLLIAAILLLITTITAPIINHLSILRVDLPGNNGQSTNSISFGTFGYCVLGGSSGDFCSSRNIGYKPSNVISSALGARFDSAASATADGLTGAMILHPIACAVAFIAFLVSLGASVIGSLVGFIIAALAWILTLVVMAIDFTLFAVIRNHANDISGVDAHYDTGMWTCLAAFVLLFFGGLVVLFTCCSARMRRRRDRRVGDRAVAHHEAKTDYGAPRRSRWNRWRRY